MTFSPEQLNFFKFSSVVLDEFPVTLRSVFVFMWDTFVATTTTTPSIPKWDGSITVHNIFLTKEGGRKKAPTLNKSYKDWDCTALFKATLFAQTFAMPDGTGGVSTLDSLYVRPLGLSAGTFHSSVRSATGNQAETCALALDQLRLLRNTLCHQISTRKIDKATFAHYLSLAKEAFTALKQNTSRMNEIGKLAEDDFPTARLKQLEEDLKREKDAAITFKQIDDHLIKIESKVEGVVSEVKDINTGVTDVKTQVENVGSDVKDVKTGVTDTLNAIHILLQEVSSSRVGPPSCSLSERRNSVSEHEPQPVGETIQPSPEEPDIWVVISSFGNSLDLFFKYLNEKLRLDIFCYETGSLFITVKCSSVDILDELWKDYKSGHLNEVAEEILITTQVLEKLCLAELKFKTIINEEHYKKCREFLVSQETILLQHQEDAPRGIGSSSGGIHEEVYLPDLGMQAAAEHGMEDFIDFWNEAAQARSVIEIEDDSHFQSEMTSAGDKLVVVNYAARCCAYSIMINPTFSSLSTKYPAAKFLIVDTDKCKDVALRNGVTGSPKFQLFKGNQPKKKVDQVNGADEELLEEKIQKWISTEDCVVPGHVNLLSFINKDGCKCLNGSDVLSVLTKGPEFVESKNDEQLLVTIAFNQNEAVKLHFLKIQGPDDGRGAKTVRIFLNPTRNMSFADAKRWKPKQTLELAADDIREGAIIPLSFVKFQNVSSLTFFFSDNQGKKDTTVVEYMEFIGCPVS